MRFGLWLGRVVAAGWNGVKVRGEEKNTPFLINAVETAQLGLEVDVSSLATELVPIAGAIAVHLKDDMVAAGGMEGYPVASHGVWGGRGVQGEIYVRVLLVLSSSTISRAN